MESPVSIEGVVEANYSDGDSECICCPGPHRFSIGITTEPFDYPWASGQRTSVHDWLNMQLARTEPGELDGKRVRVTLEVID